MANITIDSDNYFIQEIPIGKKQELSYAVAITNGYTEKVKDVLITNEVILQSDFNKFITEIDLIENKFIKSKEVINANEVKLIIEEIIEIDNPITFVEFANNIISNKIGQVVRKSVEQLKLISLNEQLENTKKAISEQLDSELSGLSVI